MARVKLLHIDLPRCSAVVGYGTKLWRTSGGDDDEVCRQNAKYEIDGRALCGRHAGAAAIKVLMEVDD